MKFFTFSKNDSDFSDILSDPSIKGSIRTKLAWDNHLMLGFDDDKIDDKKLFGYVVLKYGDNIVYALHPDFSPINGKDYKPYVLLHHRW